MLYACTIVACRQEALVRRTSVDVFMTEATCADAALGIATRINREICDPNQGWCDHYAAVAPLTQVINSADDFRKLMKPVEGK